MEDDLKKNKKMEDDLKKMKIGQVNSLFSLISYGLVSNGKVCFLKMKKLLFVWLRNTAGKK